MQLQLERSKVECTQCSAVTKASDFLRRGSNRGQLHGKGRPLPPLPPNDALPPWVMATSQIPGKFWSLAGTGSVPTPPSSTPHSTQTNPGYAARTVSRLPASSHVCSPDSISTVRKRTSSESEWGFRVICRPFQSLLEERKTYASFWLS